MRIEFVPLPLSLPSHRISLPSQGVSWIDKNVDHLKECRINTAALDFPEPIVLQIAACGPAYQRFFHSSQSEHPLPFGNIATIAFESSIPSQVQDVDDGGTDEAVEDLLSATHNFDDFYDDEESALLLNLDPTEFKKQDHYAVLGLSRLRWAATDDDIKKAYRKKALKHHPDKQQSRSDNFFKCIQKAYEVLSDPTKRRLFDSSDDSFDDSLPSSAKLGSIKTPDDFFQVFAPLFQRTAYFSKKRPVPPIGSMATSIHSVDKFYDFWTSFESWRTFSTEDDDEGEGENRWERRYLEKQRRAEREKKKKEEKARILQLVDLAMRHDPRILKMKAEEKASKEAKRQARLEAIKKAEEEAKRAEEEALREKEQMELEMKRAQEEEKKEKEARKKALKAEKRTIREFLSSVRYFCAPDTKDTSPEYIQQLKNLDVVLEYFGDDVEELSRLNASLSSEGVSLDDARNNYEKVLKVAQDEAQKRKAEEEEKERLRREQEEKRRNMEEARKKERPWTVNEMKTLIKAVNMFPGGTLDRWETIADYIAQHNGDTTERRKAQECIRKSKEMHKIASHAESTFQQFERRKEDHLRSKNEPTLREDSDAPANNENTTTTPASSTESISEAAKVKKPPKPWTAEEQKALETALRTFPSSGPNAYTGTDRWDKIAEMIPGRTKKQVMLRVKELAQRVKK